MTTRPTYRYLRGYALDPGFSTRLDTAAINEVVYRIPFEPLAPGPRGEYLDVIDVDPASGCWYEPVDLREEEIASQHGLSPSEGLPQFHQQLVYCSAMKTIRHFEQALGRKIIWFPRFNPRRKPDDDPSTSMWEYVQHLRIHPHAIRDANAYYDPDKTALLFGYFDAANEFYGANLPGGLVFTCLSPDIVAHETTHAILDSIHHRYIEDTNPDVAAFHEGFADIVALLQRFTFRELVQDQLSRSSGRLDGDNVLGALATQFGEALEGNRGALRSMIGTRDETGNWVPYIPNPSDYATNFEAHDRGAVLVATVFDAFQRIYTFRTRDLFRIASNGTGVLPKGSISPDLVARLAREAEEIAGHFLHICIRALDYCPPVDITFGDYFRALITADVDIAPEDETGYRVALIEAFRARGIFPHGVNMLSVDSLRWTKPVFTEEQRHSLEFLAGKLQPHVAALVATQDRREVFDLSQKAQAMLHELLLGKAPIYGPQEWESFLNKLGLTSLPLDQLFGETGKGLKFRVAKGQSTSVMVPPIEVHTVRPAFRAGREGRQIEQVLMTLTQTVRVDIGTKKEPNEIVFRGGCSLIFGLGNLNSAEYVVSKSIKSYERYRAQVDYITGESGESPDLTMYADGRERRLNFQLLHRT
ncbi:MAG: hypothetical protein JWM95_1598 [Gemmatimonadetes bacterium]|nr:hypothetical protein [Gemmatimonadota bacterium]